jgi:hypothetical protein
MRMKTIITALTLVVLIASLALSQYSAQESFVYRSGGDSLSQRGTATDGWGGPWTQFAGGGWGNRSALFTDTTASVTVGLTPMAYADLIYPITNVGSHVSVSTPGSWGATDVYMRPLDKQWPNQAGKNYWVSFVFDQGPVPTSGAYDNSTFYAVKLYDSTARELLAIGKQGGANVYSCGSGWSGDPSDPSLVEMTTDPVWLVTKMVMTGATDTIVRTYMWINPDPTGTEPDTNVADVKRWSRMPNGFNLVTVSNGGNDKITTNYDEIRLGDSWALVSSPQYAAHESFDYTASGDSLSQKGTATDGWSGPWTQFAGGGWGNRSALFTDTTASVTVGLTPMAYADLIYPITNVGSHVSVSTPGSWGATDVYMRPLDKQWPNQAGKNYWVSFVFDQGPVPTSGAYDNSTFYTVKLYDSTARELLAIGKQGGANVYSCGSGWSGDPNDPSLVEMTTDPVWLVTKMVMTGATDTIVRTYMWINPDPTGTEPDTNVADVKRWSRMPNGFNLVTVSNGGNDKITTNYDEIRLGTDWTSVSYDFGTDVKQVASQNQPNRFNLSQNYPNPFNPTTQLNYMVKQSGFVSLKVYNLLGQHVATLYEGVRQAGDYQVTFNASNLPSGVYFARLQNGTNSITKKMMLLK